MLVHLHLVEDLLGVPEKTVEFVALGVAIDILHYVLAGLAGQAAEKWVAREVDVLAGEEVYLDTEDLFLEVLERGELRKVFVQPGLLGVLPTGAVVLFV